MKEWLEEAKGVALGALRCLELSVAFGVIGGCGLGCLLFVVRIFERIGNLIMGAW